MVKVALGETKNAGFRFLIGKVSTQLSMSSAYQIRIAFRFLIGKVSTMLSCAVLSP